MCEFSIHLIHIHKPLIKFITILQPHIYKVSEDKDIYMEEIGLFLLKLIQNKKLKYYPA